MRGNEREMKGRKEEKNTRGGSQNSHLLPAKDQALLRGRDTLLLLDELLDLGDL